MGDEGDCMKKISLGLIVVFLVFMLSSCVTTSLMKVNGAIGEDGNVSIEITNVIQKRNHGWWWWFCIPITPVESQGLEVVIINNTDKPQSINWNKSSLNWHNRSSSLFLEGMKYSQSGSNTIPNTAIGVNQSVSVILFPANNVNWTNDGWEMDGMQLKVGDVISLVAFTETGLQIETTYKVEESDDIHFWW